MVFWGVNRRAASRTGIGICRGRAGGSFALVRDGQGADRPVLLDYGPLAATDENPQPSPFSQVIRRHKLQGAPAVLVMAGGDYQLLQIDMPELSTEERREAARWQIRDMIDFQVAEAIVDLFDVLPYGGDRKPLTYAVTARQSLLRSGLDSVLSADLKPSIIDIPEFALRNIADLYAEESRGVGILYLQAESGLLTIAREGVLYLSRSFPFGMDCLMPYVDSNLEALTEQVDAIVLEIQRSFDYCESTFHLPMVSKLLVAQTEREIPVVTNYLADFLATDVQPLCLETVLELPEGHNQLELNRYLLAIGGALRREDD